MPHAMRKVRGKDLFKVWNTETGEIKSSGSTKADAKAQLRLLRGLEKKEKKGGALKADQIKDVIDFSYNNKKDDAPKGYAIDKDLSDGRVKVYKDLNSNQVIVAHRGSSGWKDWLDNAYYATTGNVKDSGTYKTHKKKHEKALDKYGAENVISIGHSRAGKYVEELNKEKPVKEVLTYNKAVGIHDVFQKNPENQTDIRSSRDLVSGLSSFQRSKNKVVNIASNTLNPLKAHGTSALSSLGNKLIGKGVKQMRVGEMRKFVKAFKRAKYGENWTGGAKYGKKQLAEMIRPMMEDDDIDEMVGGSVWTDFVKEFSAKHSLKYACALSKYKEPLKKAYRLKKENKEWYEPFKIDAISGTDPIEKPKENISMTIEEPKPVISKGKEEPKIVEELDNETTFPILVYQTPVYKPLIESIEKLILKKNYIVPAYLLNDKASKTLLNNMFDYWSKKVGVLQAIKKIDEGVRNIVAYLGGEEQLSPNMDMTGYMRHLSTKNKRILDEALEKKVSGSGVLSGGNKWTDFVKDYAKKYDTTYGCALSDMNIKGAYKLFKDGKAWYFPKTSVMETQTDEIVEPEPTKAPENIEPVINRIEEKIKEFENLGAEKGAVSYLPSTLITDIAFVNLMKKYGGKCIVNNVMKTTGIELGIDINSVASRNKMADYSVFERLGEKLSDCIQRGVKLILIPLSLQFGTSVSGHANMIIYRPFKRLVERYEPHGVSYGNSMVDNKSFNDQLRKLFEVDLKKWIGDVRYKQPDEFCPNPKGFQSLEGQLDSIASEGGGFCSMWSFFVAEMTFLNPDKTTSEILDEVYDISKSDPAYLRSVIRGYVIEAEKGLDALLKELGKDGFSFKKSRKGNEAYYKIYDNKTELEAWLLNSVFDTKKYSEAPPMYEPLPDVILKGKSDKEKLKETFFDKLRFLSIAEITKMYSVYGLQAPKSKKDDMINQMLTRIVDGEWDKYGASSDLSDINVILAEELHKGKGAFRSGLARSGYFKNK